MQDSSMNFSKKYPHQRTESHPQKSWNDGTMNWKKTASKMMQIWSETNTKQLEYSECFVVVDRVRIEFGWVRPAQIQLTLSN